MSNFNLKASETIQKLSELNVWHEVQKYDYFSLVGIQGRGGNNFYWFKVFNDDDTLFFDHSYSWSIGKSSKSRQKFSTAYNTINRLIKNN
jgi:hypothetical protein